MFHKCFTGTWQISAFQPIFHWSFLISSPIFQKMCIVNLYFLKRKDRYLVFGSFLLISNLVIYKWTEKKMFTKYWTLEKARRRTYGKWVDRWRPETVPERGADSKIFSFIQVLFMCVIVGFTSSSFIFVTVTKTLENIR